VTAIHRDGKKLASDQQPPASTCASESSLRGPPVRSVAPLTGRPRTIRIVPFRGGVLTKIPSRAQHLVSQLIYPVPMPKFPFLVSTSPASFTAEWKGSECSPRIRARRLSVKRISTPRNYRCARVLRPAPFLAKVSEDVLAGIAGLSAAIYFARRWQRWFPKFTRRPDRGRIGVRAQAMHRTGH